MKLSCKDEDMPALCEALAQDMVPALLMERTGPGWIVTYLRPGHGEAVSDLLARGVVRLV